MNHWVRTWEVNPTVGATKVLQKCSDFDSDDTSVQEIPKSEANLPSDGKCTWLDIWKLNWGSAKAMNHRSAFTWLYVYIYMHGAFKTPHGFKFSAFGGVPPGPCRQLLMHPVAFFRGQLGLPAALHSQTRASASSGRCAA